MTLAWYGHLKFKSVPLVTVVLVSWGIAFMEYCFAVPANRIGSGLGSRLDASEEVADRQNDVGDDGNPECVGADEWERNKGADDGQDGQDRRDDEYRGGRRRKIHGPALPLVDGEL
jgi:hypothetical protein